MTRIDRLQNEYDARMLKRKHKKVGISLFIPEDIKQKRRAELGTFDHRESKVSLTIHKKKTPPPIVSWRHQEEGEA